MALRWSPSGKVTVVTGAAGGIGSALVAALRRRGARVIATDLIDGPLVDRALDVRDAAAFEALIADVVDRHGRIDVLVNNAGIAYIAEAEEADLEHWRRIVEVNLMGVVHGVLAAYPQMVAQGAGRIVNVASMAGVLPSPLLVPYATTKHGVVGLSTSLRIEARAKGVGIHVICPGPIETPMLDTHGPADLEPLGEQLDGRRYLTSLTGGRSYPPERLAVDVIEAIERDRPVLVAPAAGRVAHRLYRWAPALMLRLGGVGVRRELSAGRGAR